MTTEVDNVVLAKLFSVEVVASLIGGALMVGIVYATLQADIASAQSHAGKAEMAAAEAELHSIQRANKDERALKEITTLISSMQSNQATFAAAIAHMTRQQDRILDKLDTFNGG